MSAHTDISGHILQSTVPAFRLIDSELGQVKQLINEQLANSSKSVSRLLKTFSGCSGKMFRPGLVLLSYRVVCNASHNKNTQYAIRNTQHEVIRVAAIVEMIHNATLLHDDVIDEGQKRRGLLTVNNLWGNESAVLLGDFLLSQVFKMCGELDGQLQRTIAAATARICEGEIRQISQRQNWKLNEPEYIDIITEKSASFFSSCCLLGGLLADASEQELQSLNCFGRNVGIAFQITDDLLDIMGDENKTGKTLGSDVKKDKPTLALIHLLRTADEEKQAAVIDSYLERNTNKPALMEMLRSYGSLEYTRQRAQEFAEKAISALAEIGGSCAKDALIETARFVANRAI